MPGPSSCSPVSPLKVHLGPCLLVPVTDMKTHLGLPLAPYSISHSPLGCHSEPPLPAPVFALTELLIFLLEDLQPSAPGTATSGELCPSTPRPPTAAETIFRALPGISAHCPKDLLCFFCLRFSLWQFGALLLELPSWLA